MNLINCFIDPVAQAYSGKPIQKLLNALLLSTYTSTVVVFLLRTQRHVSCTGGTQNQVCSQLLWDLVTHWSAHR
jgi:hypothetical protein